MLTLLSPTKCLSNSTKGPAPTLISYRSGRTAVRSSRSLKRGRELVGRRPSLSGEIIVPLQRGCRPFSQLLVSRSHASLLSCLFQGTHHTRDAHASPTSGQPDGPSIPRRTPPDYQEAGGCKGGCSTPLPSSRAGAVRQPRPVPFLPGPPNDPPCREPSTGSHPVQNRTPRFGHWEPRPKRGESCGAFPVADYPHPTHPGSHSWDHASSAEAPPPAAPSAPPR